MKQLVHARDQLLRAEGLGDVVQRTEFETQVSGVGRSPRGDDDDWNDRSRRVTSQDFTDTEAVQVGQHQIKQDEVWPVGPDGVDGFPAIGGDSHLIPGPHQVEMHEIG